MRQNTRWRPDPFTVGEIVVDVDRPTWGKGRIVKEEPARGSETGGQRLWVEFENRGRVTVFTTLRTLRRVTAA
jgi:hypothetical protein